MSPAMVPLLGTAGVLFALELALRPWRPLRKHLGHNLIYALLAYVPIVLVPLGTARWVTLAAAVIALGALVSYARMVGLTQFPRFFVPTALAALACFVAARVQWYGLFQAMPVFGIFAIVALAVVGREAEAFLQKLCLSWLALLVYGYLWSHAALFTDPSMIDHQPGLLLLSVVLLLAKCADVGWVAARRWVPGHPRLQLWVSPLAGALGGAVLAAVSQPGDPLLRTLRAAWELAVLGAIMGGGLSFASRSFDLIVQDVLGPAAADLRRPLKGTMLFGFAFGLALCFHWLRWRSEL